MTLCRLGLPTPRGQAVTSPAPLIARPPWGGGRGTPGPGPAAGRALSGGVEGGYQALPAPPRGPAPGASRRGAPRPPTAVATGPAAALPAQQPASPTQPLSRRGPEPGGHGRSRGVRGRQESPGRARPPPPRCTCRRRRCCCFSARSPRGRGGGGRRQLSPLLAPRHATPPPA